MPNLVFDKYGLLPAGIHECTMEEVKSLLAWNDRRRQLTMQLQEFIEVELSMRFSMIPPLVLDGSYVTKKDEPGNINLILELQELPDAHKMSACDLCQRCPDIFLRYEIDMNPSLASGNGLIDSFSKLKTSDALAMNLYHDHRKGLLRLR